MADVGLCACMAVFFGLWEYIVSTTIHANNLTFYFAIFRAFLDWDGALVLRLEYMNRMLLPEVELIGCT